MSSRAYSAVNKTVSEMSKETFLKTAEEQGLVVLPPSLSASNPV